MIVRSPTRFNLSPIVACKQYGKLVRLKTVATSYRFVSNRASNSHCCYHHCRDCNPTFFPGYDHDRYLFPSQQQSYCNQLHQYISYGILRQQMSVYLSQQRQVWCDASAQELLINASLCTNATVPLKRNARPWLCRDCQGAHAEISHSRSGRCVGCLVQ